MHVRLDWEAPPSLEGPQHLETKARPLQNQLPAYAFEGLAVRVDANEDVNTARAAPPEAELMASAPVAAAAAGMVGAAVPETVVSLTRGLAVNVV